MRIAPLAAMAVVAGWMGAATAQAEQLPWQASTGAGQNAYQPAPYQPPANGFAQPQDQAAYQPPPLPRNRRPPLVQADDANPQPVEPMQPVSTGDGFGRDEITGAGHRFFGRVTTDLASVIEYAFRQNGRPNGYILGEEGSGAFVAGLRYGEGTLYTRNAGIRKVFWQGPSIGFDWGGEGSKIMFLVYNMHSPDDVYYNYVGVGGQAYVVGGVGITYLKSGPVTMAPIRSGLGLRIGANVGYVKFTRAPTWNPF